MLQQTQVTTVIPYFERFISRFPDIDTLANADLNDVLHMWTGLGYYARARNLHKTAQIISVDHKGIWPNTIDQLASLPGIGLSTAGAIASLGMGQRAAILDGNVKRVLCRVHQVTGWPGSQVVQKTLWQISNHYTPKKHFADFNQAMMDLGATLCTRTKPNCQSCPLKTLCGAHLNNDQQQYPHKKPKQTKKIKNIHFLVLLNKSKIWLEQRPPNGIWGGLWSFPEFPSIQTLKDYCETNWDHQLPIKLKQLPKKRHTFTHFHLDYTAVIISLKNARPNNDQTNKITAMKDATTHNWFDYRKKMTIGLPAPILEEINQIKQSHKKQPEIEIC